MSLLYLDTFSGISGDMFLGLLVDLGVPPTLLETELAGLPLTGWRLEVRREKRMGIEGTRVEVRCEEERRHRTWSDIDAMLRQSALAPPVVDLARRIFRFIGEAEAKVHGIALDTVHFHEVGALDSIIDVVGAAVGIAWLNPRRIVCSPLPLSRGTVRTAHGLFPLPAPATAEILKGAPVVDAASDRELVTPTGAAIAAAVAEFAPIPSMRLVATGYGVGGWKLADRPNLLRGFLGEEETTPIAEHDRVSVLETHLDDANPEWLGALMERLLDDGALDVGYSPLQMKKNRPGLRLTVICPPHRAQSLARVLLRESSAIGVRRYETARVKLRREPGRVETAWGEARVKILFDGEDLVRVTPEYESCRRISAEHAVPLPNVYRAVERAADEQIRGE